MYNGMVTDGYSIENGISGSTYTPYISIWLALIDNQPTGEDLIAASDRSVHLNYDRNIHAFTKSSNTTLLIRVRLHVCMLKELLINNIIHI
jgi:hypothetical protein